MNIPAEQLIPHQPPLRLIDTLTHCDATSARAVAQFSADHFAVSGGWVLEAALVECVAQTVAAALGHAAKSGGGEKPALGMLAAVNDFQIHSRPSAGQLLEIEIREIKQLGPLRLIAGTIHCAGQLIAKGELTLYA